MATHAAKTLTDQLASARAHRAQVATWQATNEEHRTRAGQLIDLAAQAKEILPAADTATKRRILALLDVNIHVQSWDRCPTCQGTGWVSRLASSPARRAKRKTPKSEFGGLVCPGCHRHRWIPRFAIEGTVPQSDLATPSTTEHSTRWPFRVVGHDDATGS